MLFRPPQSPTNFCFFGGSFSVSTPDDCCTKGVLMKIIQSVAACAAYVVSNFWFLDLANVHTGVTRTRPTTTKKQAEATCARVWMNDDGLFFPRHQHRRHRTFVRFAPRSSCHTCRTAAAQALSIQSERHRAM